MRTRRVFSIINPVLCALTLLGQAADIQAETRYKIIRIPTPDGFDSTALGLNDSGNVVGYSYQGMTRMPSCTNMRMARSLI